jgi:hypothetical protein
MEQQEARNRKRWDAFRVWLMNYGLLATYSSWFPPNGSLPTFENWLADQQARKLQGLPTDPLYDQYLAFQDQYTY